jgi:polygalacturonase
MLPKFHSYRWIIFSLVVLAAPSFECCHCAEPALDFDPAQAWASVPDILQRIVPPVFPEREFDITDFGAVADADTLSTDAFKQAIAACHQAGGGRVVVPSGQFLTGPIHLLSNVELHLAEGSEIIFSNRFADYLPPVLVRVGGVELYNFSPLIYARDCTNIAVTGKGKLNGNAEAWWDWKSRETKRGFEMGEAGVPVEERVFGSEAAAIRPSFLSFVECRNVLLEDFTIGSGPNWTIHPIYCENTTIRGVYVITNGPNNDGIDPDSCRDMLIENCTFDTGDDCVVLKSGYNQDGWRVGRPTENVIMRNCTSKRGHGGLVIGSEMSGDVRNVFMEDCDFSGTDRAIRIKSRADRGGVVENIFARNLNVKDMQREVIILNMDYASDRSEITAQHAPIFRNMQFENIRGNGAPVAILIQGLANSPIKNINFLDMRITSTKGVVANEVQDLRFENCKIDTSESPVFALSNAADITIRQGAVPPRADIFLKVAGARSRNILIETIDLSAMKSRVQVSDDITADIVTVK